MLWKKIVGSIVFIGGVFLFLLSNYIAEQVLIGQKKIDKAQNHVNTGKKLFSLSPYTKGVGNAAAGSAQKKINAGKSQVDEYSVLSRKLYVAGIVVALGGIAVFIWGFTRKKR